MALTPGTRLGAYEVITLLGAGGMGEVYRGRDTRLDRTVAIKILPETLAGDRQFRDRFDREARTISQLDHPHICTLYDVGEQDGTSFLVMQYLEGETLEARLRKGALPLDRALQFSIQIADALDKAHRAGIVHRDLKPANIMLTKAGATLLDFGLAKATAPVGPSSLSMLPTTPPHLTAQGAILGTFQYMAPEQLEGQEADARTDIFAYGLVLYEMLTRQRAFAGKTRASLISGILKDEPLPISTQQPSAPASLDHIVRRCLAKDPGERWQAAADLVLELKWVVESATRPSDSTIDRRFARPSARERIIWTSATAIAIAAAVSLGTLYLRRAPVSDNPLMRFVVAPPKEVALAIGSMGQSNLAMSPDGRRLAFVARQGARTLLWVQAFDALDAQLLAGTEGAAFPFWSPDGRALGFFTGGTTLKTVDASGGPVRVLGRAPSLVLGGTWGPDGTIAFGSNVGGLFTISASGGQAADLTHLDTGQGEISHRFPVFLPDGRHLLYSSQPSNTAWLASLDSTERRRQLLQTDSQVQYLEPGYLLFGRQATLMAQAFDWRRGTLAGDAVRLAEQVLRDPNSGSLAFAASTGATLAYRTEADAPTTQLTWFDRSGRPLGTIESSGPYRNLALSPDGKRVAVEVADVVTRTQDVWLVDTSRGAPSRLTFDPANDVQPIWSPDGDWIIFGSDRSGVFNLYRKRSSGAGIDELVLKSSVPMSPNTFTPDGRAVLYRTVLNGFLQIGILPLGGEETPRLFDQKAASYSQGRVSPDGKWMAYLSNESGRSEIYIESFPTPGGGKWQISKSGGSHLRWGRDGHELIYYALDGRLMSVPIGNGPALDIGTVVPLFEPHMLGGPFPRLGYQAQWDVAPDGRFLVIMPVEESSASAINVVVNWEALVKK